MDSFGKLRVRKQRAYSAHHQFIRIANSALWLAEKQQPGWADQVMIATTFGAVALEAFCKMAGDRLIKNWDDFETCSPLTKSRILCEHLDIPFDRQQQPGSSLVWLMSFRNRVVHAKPEG